MSDSLQPGDLVTGSPPRAGASSYFSATLKSTPYPLLRLPRSSIMIVVKIPSQSPTSKWPPQTACVTVLHDGQLFDVFLNDVQLLTGTDS